MEIYNNMLSIILQMGHHRGLLGTFINLKYNDSFAKLVLAHRSLYKNPAFSSAKQPQEKLLKLKFNWKGIFNRKISENYRKNLCTYLFWYFVNNLSGCCNYIFRWILVVSRIEHLELTQMFTENLVEILQGMFQFSIKAGIKSIFYNILKI